MSFFGGVWHGLDEAFFMFWETLWPLVLGFSLSGAVQAFVSRDQMERVMGDLLTPAMSNVSSGASKRSLDGRSRKVP